MIKGIEHDKIKRAEVKQIFKDISASQLLVAHTSAMAPPKEVRIKSTGAQVGLFVSIIRPRASGVK